MPTLIDLPNEIIHRICVLAQSAESAEPGRVGYNAKLCKNALMALCRTCRGVRDIAQDVLYQTLGVSWDGKGSLIPLWLLVRTTSIRPDLAQKVKTLTVPITPQAAIELTAPGNRVPTDIEHACTTPHQRTSRKVWAYEVLHDLLCHLTNVETLRFTVIALNVDTSKSYVPSEVLDEMRQTRIHSALHSLHSPATHSTAGVSSQKTLHSSLKTLEFSHETMVGRPLHSDLNEIGSIFRLSTLHSLTVRCRQITFHPDIPLLRPDATIHLMKVALIGCSMDPASLNHLCTVVTRLQHFALVIADPVTIHRETLLGHPQLDQLPHVRQPTPQQMVDELSHRADTLEGLRLDCSEWYHNGCEALWNHDGTDPSQRYPSFKHFTKLTTLNVEFDRICSPIEVPKSLVALTLTRMSPSPCLTEEPLHYPRLGKRYKKLIEDSICPSLSYVKLGRFIPFRYDAGRLLDWRHITASRWNDFISDQVSFTDAQYVWRDGHSGGSADNFELDTWRDDWWGIEFTALWPKELKTDILAFVHREAQRWSAY